MTDVRALLLTDVVDSTKLAERIGDDAMADAWVAHDGSPATCCICTAARDRQDGRHADDVRASRRCRCIRDGLPPALAALAVPLVARAGLHVGR